MPVPTSTAASQSKLATLKPVRKQRERQRPRRQKEYPDPDRPVQEPVIGLVAGSHLAGVRIFHSAAVAHGESFSEAKRERQTGAGLGGGAVSGLQVIWAEPHIE